MDARSRAIRWVFARPSADDLTRLLLAWRLWILAGLAGAMVGAAIFAVAPPPYRAMATVNVDFHMEQAWPENTDREQFYYLERETRKLEEIAFADATLSVVSQSVPGITAEHLRRGAAQLGQPGNGGWHFYGWDRDPRTAEAIASSWAAAFSQRVSEAVAAGASSGLERFITVDLIQAEMLLPERSPGVGVYMLAGAILLAGLAALSALMFHIER